MIPLKKNNVALAFLILLLSSTFLLPAFAQADQPVKPDQTSKPEHASVTDEDSPKEDWTTLSIKGLDLKSVPPMPGGTSEHPEFTRELVRLQWRHGDPIDIYIVRPRAVAKPHVILYLYGYPSDTDRFRNDEWCKTATEGGFAAVGFVSALTGERYQGRPMKQWFVSELAEALGKSTHDVQKILDYLGERPDLNVEKVGMYGQGSGASIAILAASVDSRIAVLDLLDPWGDWPDWIKLSPVVPENERPAFLTPEFLDKVAKLDPLQVLPKLTTQTLRVQLVADDVLTPASACDRIAAAAPPGAQVVKYENRASLRKAWKEKGLWNWAKNQLQNLPAPASAQHKPGH